MNTRQWRTWPIVYLERMMNSQRLGQSWAENVGIRVGSKSSENLI